MCNENSSEFLSSFAESKFEIRKRIEYRKSLLRNLASHRIVHSKSELKNIAEIQQVFGI